MFLVSLRCLIKPLSSSKHVTKAVPFETLSVSTHIFRVTTQNYHSELAAPDRRKNVENQYTYNLLKSIINPNVSSIPINGDNLNASLKLIQSVNNGSESVEALNALPNQFNQDIAKLSDEEIAAIFNELKSCTSASIVQDVVSIINREAIERMPRADPSAALSICLSLIEMGVAHRSEWTWAALKRYCRRLDKLTSHQMLQVMHLAHVCRRFPPAYSNFDIQYQLVNHFDHLSLQEMAIISITFFKTQNKLNNKVIMSKILRKLLEDSGSCDSFSLAMLSKIIRYSMPLSLSDELYVFQSEMAARVDQFSETALVHLALSGTSVLLYNEQLISAILNRLRRDISKLRLKDMERLLLVISLFNVKDDDFISRVLKEVELREEEIALYPKAFVSLVQYLTILQHYNYKLIDTVLSQRFISETYGLSYRKIASEIIYIDSSVAIERPDYTGNRLSPKLVTTSAKISKFSISGTNTGTQKFSYELEDVLKRLYGERNVLYTSLIPHYHYPDFLLGFDESLTPQAVPEESRVHKWGDIKHPPDKERLWLAVIVGGWNMAIRNTNQPLGTLAAKIRQLRVLGYHSVTVPYTEWRTIPDKETYLMQLIGNELDNAKASK